MVWEGVKGVGLPVEEEVEGVDSLVEEGVEGVGLSVGDGAGSWLSASIFSFNLFMYVLWYFLPRSCHLESFVTFLNILSMFIVSENHHIRRTNLSETYLAHLK